MFSAESLFASLVYAVAMFSLAFSQFNSVAFAKITPVFNRKKLCSYPCQV